MLYKRNVGKDSYYQLVFFQSSHSRKKRKDYRRKEEKESKSWIISPQKTGPCYWIGLSQNVILQAARWTMDSERYLEMDIVSYRYVPSKKLSGRDRNRTLWTQCGSVLSPEHGDFQGPSKAPSLTLATDRHFPESNKKAACTRFQGYSYQGCSYSRDLPVVFLEPVRCG